MVKLVITKSRIQETLDLLTFVDGSPNTKYFFIYFLFSKKKYFIDEKIMCILFRRNFLFLPTLEKTTHDLYRY